MSVIDLPAPLKRLKLIVQLVGILICFWVPPAITFFEKYALWFFIFKKLPVNNSMPEFSSMLKGAQLYWFLLILVLTVLGWIPGVIAALCYLFAKDSFTCFGK